MSGQEGNIRFLPKTSVGDVMKRYNLSKVAELTGDRPPVVLDMPNIKFSVTKMKYDTFYIFDDRGILYGTHRLIQNDRTVPVYILAPETMAQRGARGTDVVYEFRFGEMRPV